jgi:hypothetical protein
MHENALPKDFPNSIVRGVTAIQLYWDAVGPFDNCSY